MCHGTHPDEGAVAHVPTHGTSHQKCHGTVESSPIPRLAPPLESGDIKQADSPSTKRK